MFGYRARLGYISCSIVKYLAVVSFLAGLFFCITPLSAQVPYYKGKTIRLIVGYPTGGGVDAEGRLLARFLERYIPGNPTILVQNMPGAGGLVAANWFEQMPKADGLTLQYTSSSSINQQVFGAERANFDLRGWELIGSLRRGTSVALIHPEKLKRLTGPGEPLKVGTRTADDSWSSIFLWGAEYLNWNVRWVMGYGGGGELRLGFQRNETDIYSTAALPALRELVGAGYHPFVQQGRLTAAGKFQRRQEFPDVPTFQEILGERNPGGVAWQAYRIWAGSDSAGRPLYAPAKTPAEVMHLLREAFSRVDRDGEFRAELKKVAGEDADLLLAQEADPLLRQLLIISPEIREFANALTKKHLKR